MYAASFVVRTGAKDEPYWHTDWEWILGKDACDKDERSNPMKQARPNPNPNPHHNPDSTNDGGTG